MNRFMFQIIVWVIVLILALTFPALAYSNDYPANAPVKGAAYIEAQVSGLGRALIIIPVNSMEYISQQSYGENLINVSSGTITGRIYTGANYNTEYTYRLQAFGTSQYQNPNNNTWNDITVTQIYNTNVPILDNSGENPVQHFKIPVWAAILILLLLVVILCLFFKQL